jgi:ribosome biogenesis GTPase
VEALLAAAPTASTLGRVVRVDRSAAHVVTATGVVAVRAPVAVGDWVALAPDVPPAVVAVAERWSELARSDPSGGRQVLAANVDVVLITCPADRPSAARVEREVVLAWDSGARPVVLVTKADLDDGTVAAALAARLVGVDVVPTSSRDVATVRAVADVLTPDRTAVVLGPSGAGKSTLINGLVADAHLATGAVRATDARGRHTTSRRELVAVPTGGTVIDTPGVRSLGLGADAQDGLAAGFTDIGDIARKCRFRDCAHDREPGCAVRDAVEVGDLDAARLASYRKLVREMAHEARRTDPVAARAERDRWKAVHKAHRRRGRP